MINVTVVLTEEQALAAMDAMDTLASDLRRYEETTARDRRRFGYSQRFNTLHDASENIQNALDDARRTPCAEDRGNT